MVDTETSMVFAHVCKRKGGDPDIFATLVEDIEVLGHRQIVRVQERPRGSTQGGKRHGGQRSAARDRFDHGAEGRTGGQHQALKKKAYFLVMTFMVNHAATWIRMARRRWRRHAGRPQTANREVADFWKKGLFHPLTK